jgi:hypothetical protein
MPFSSYPACLPIVQSELPHYQTSRAVNLLRSALPSLLTWPCLPQRSVREHLHMQSASGFPGLVLDQSTSHVYVVREKSIQKLDELELAYLERNTLSGALTAEDAAGLFDILRAPAPQTRRFAINSQILGPISLALQLTDDQHRPLIYDPMLREALAHHLALRLSWLTNRLTAQADHVIVSLDEPLLEALDSPFCPLSWQEGIDLIEQVISGVDGVRGLILRATDAQQIDNLPRYRELLRDTSLELIWLDMQQPYGARLAAVLLPDLLERGGTLVWGVVPTTYAALQRATADTLLAHFEHLLDGITSAGLNREQVLQASLIGTSDSLARVPIAAAERAVRLCADVSSRVRARHELVAMGETP